MKLFIAASMFGLGAANIAAPSHKKCLDIKAPCKSGKEEKGCDRVAPKDIEKGANLQMWDCHDEANQVFELIDGRLHNELTGLCIDIQAPCADGSKTPGCKRQALKDIKDEANVQLWTCRKDDAAGFASSSYGNQKFDLMKDGTMRNEATNFCLTAHKVCPGGDKTKCADETNGASVHVNKCGDVEDPGDQTFIFKATIDPAKDFTRLVEVQDFVQLPSPTADGSPAAFTAMAVGACASAVLAVVAFFRSTRSATATDLPMTNGYE